MQIFLKKTKITKSILDQSLFGAVSLYLGHPNYEVLGWCNSKQGKFRRNCILLYCKTDNVIVRLHYPNSKTIYEENKNEQTRKEGLDYDDWYFPTYYYLMLDNTSVVRTLDKDIRDDSKLKLQKFLREVEQKGQIYI